LNMDEGELSFRLPMVGLFIARIIYILVYRGKVSRVLN
jgi:hypothetical protein